MLGAFRGSPSQAIEIKASIPPPRIRFKKLYNSYTLRILKFKENYIIKVYIEEINKDKDELAANLSSNSSPKNSTIKHLLQLKT